MALTFKLLAALVTLHLLDLDPSDRDLKLGITLGFGKVKLQIAITVAW